METDHLCIGGGAAGMYAVVTAAEMGKKCLLLEPNEQLGKKLRITGKGRCNLTNDCDRDTLMRNTIGNAKFLYGAYARCTPQDVMTFFESHGVPLKIERGNRVFPESNDANDVANALRQALLKNGVSIVHARARSLILDGDCCIGVKTTDGREFYAKTTLLATGGMSYPKTGSSGDGYHLARQVGHTIVPPAPSLIPLVTRETWCTSAMGLSLRNVRLRLYHGNKCLYEEIGEMLFTHFGVSGPMVLRASSFMREGSPKEYTLSLDLKPGLTPEKLDLRIQRDLAENPKKLMGNLLRSLLPAKLIVPILMLCEISPEMKAGNLSRVGRSRLCEIVKNLVLHIRAFRPIDEAIVTRGGVNVCEVDAKTMASKLCKGLYFAGEILDVDGMTGGYNLQIAFSTGYTAGISMA